MALGQSGDEGALTHFAFKRISRVRFVRKTDKPGIQSPFGQGFRLQEGTQIEEVNRRLWATPPEALEQRRN